jgi:hypothetical protein
MHSQEPRGTDRRGNDRLAVGRRDKMASQEDFAAHTGPIEARRCHCSTVRVHAPEDRVIGRLG